MHLVDIWWHFLTRASWQTSCIWLVFGGTFPQEHHDRLHALDGYLVALSHKGIMTDFMLLVDIWWHFPTRASWQTSCIWWVFGGIFPQGFHDRLHELGGYLVALSHKRIMTDIMHNLVQTYYVQLLLLEVTDWISNIQAMKRTFITRNWFQYIFFFSLASYIRVIHFKWGLSNEHTQNMSLTRNNKNNFLVTPLIIYGLPTCLMVFSNQSLSVISVNLSAMTR